MGSASPEVVPTNSTSVMRPTPDVRFAGRYVHSSIIFLQESVSYLSHYRNSKKAQHISSSLCVDILYIVVVGRIRFRTVPYAVLLLLKGNPM